MIMASSGLYLAVSGHDHETVRSEDASLSSRHCLIAETVSRSSDHSGSHLRVIQQPVPLSGTVICGRAGDMLSDHATRPEERLHRRQHEPV
jgi:hypothetical protein